MESDVADEVIMPPPNPKDPNTIRRIMGLPEVARKPKKKIPDITLLLKSTRRLGADEQQDGEEISLEDEAKEGSFEEKGKSTSSEDEKRPCEDEVKSLE